ncbi:MAG TPA: rhodanese-like domain-containing protein [Galbitalea sp.]|nr:rhodanese-like domain-containing protein [Galbitalea sp.]
MSEALQIPVEDAIARVHGGGWLLDVREQSEWDGGHAPTAHLIPMGQIMDRLDEIPIDSEILVVCHSGYRSWQVTQALVTGGYDAVNVAGGMEAWHSAGGEVVTNGAV